MDSDPTPERPDSPDSEPLPFFVEPPPVVADLVAPPPPPRLPPPPPIVLILAGIECGVLGAIVMIGWFAFQAILDRQYWWAMLNLWGAGVYHNRVFSMGLGAATLAGAATHLFAHGVAGAVWSVAAARLWNRWAYFAGAFIASALTYWVMMNLFWPAVAPVVARFSHFASSTAAYILFAAVLSRSGYRARQLQASWTA